MKQVRNYYNNNEALKRTLAETLMFETINALFLIFINVLSRCKLWNNVTKQHIDIIITCIKNAKSVGLIIKLTIVSRRTYQQSLQHYLEY
jgi:hypothetical protein